MNTLARLAGAPRRDNAALQTALASAQAEADDLKERIDAERETMSAFRDRAARALREGRRDQALDATEQFRHHEGRLLLLEAACYAAARELDLLTRALGDGQA